MNIEKTEKIKTIKERLKNIYNELDKVDFDNSKQFSYAIQILSKITQAAYHMDKLIKELKSEDNIGNQQKQS